MGVLYLKKLPTPLIPFLTSTFLTFFSLYSVLYRLNFFHSHFVTVILFFHESRGFSYSFHILGDMQVSFDYISFNAEKL